MTSGILIWKKGLYNPWTIPLSAKGVSLMSSVHFVTYVSGSDNDENGANDGIRTHDIQYHKLAL